MCHRSDLIQQHVVGLCVVTNWTTVVMCTSQLTSHPHELAADHSSLSMLCIPDLDMCCCYKIISAIYDICIVLTFCDHNVLAHQCIVAQYMARSMIPKECCYLFAYSKCQHV